MHSHKSKTTLLTAMGGKVSVEDLEEKLGEIEILAVDYKPYKGRKGFFCIDGIIPRRKN